MVFILSLGMLLSVFVWDPDRFCFTVPFIHYPITWYGCFFACGFMAGYWLLRHIYTQVFSMKNVADPKEEATLFMDRFAGVGVLSAVVGARLGYVFFYGWPHYRHHPIDIFKVWEGGLASHGAAVAVLCGIVFFVRQQKKRFPQLSFLWLLDGMTIAVGLAAGSIRLGNFMNQEITGTPTTMPWGVSFLHPTDNHAGVPLHPVQLYEASFYFTLCACFYLLWRLRKKELGSGFLSGCFFVTLFTFRFIIEFFKSHQSALLSPDFPLRMGQILSLPFIAVGIILLIRRGHARA